MWFGLFRFRSPLLSESRLLSLPVGTEMFHFPTFPPHTLCVQVWVTGHDSCRVSPFGNPRIKARLAAPRGLSQPPTSFIGSWCQGIHRAPLLTWPQRCSRPLCSSQGTGDNISFSPRIRVRNVRGSGRSATNVSDHLAADMGKDPARTLDPQPNFRQGFRPNGLLPQDPTVCLRHTQRTTRGSRATSGSVLTRPSTVSGELVSVPPLSFCCVLTTPNEAVSANSSGHVPVETVHVPVLLRKEVIQPHLPVRLPCYDLVPIANPTFDGSLHKGWATGFGCYRLS